LNNASDDDRASKHAQLRTYLQDAFAVSDDNAIALDFEQLKAHLKPRTA